jgi:hypothetical protein
MPKDATKNVDRYKVRGGQLNEFEYAQNQKAVAEKKPKGDAKLIPGTPPEEAGEGLQPTVKATAAKTKKGTSTKTTKGPTTKTTKATAKKAAKKPGSSSTKGATAKKLAARKAAARKK